MCSTRLTWTTGPTYPGGPVQEPPPPPPPPVAPANATLANLLPVARVILGALRPFPDAYRAVLAALKTLDGAGASLTGPEPVPLSP